MGLFSFFQSIRQRNPVWIPIAAGFLIVAVLAGMWRFTPLRQYTDPETLRTLISMVRTQWWTPLAVIPAYLAANSLMFPNMVLNGAIILTLGGMLGWACAVGGSLTAASAFFFLGNRFGAGKLDFLRGERFEKVRRFLRNGGIGAVVAVRMVPIAPYAVVNTAAGTIDLRFRDYFIGTFIAHLPGTLTLAVFGEQLETVIMDPSAKNIMILATVLLLGIGLVWIVKRYAGKHADNV